MPEDQLPNSEVRSPLPRSVWILSWVSFFADVSSEMMYPLLPLFLVTVLGASKTQLGAMEGGAVLIVAVMSALAGMSSDRKGAGGGRVPWIRWGYGLPVLGKAIIALAIAWPLVLTGRLLDRFGKGLRGAPRDALIADAVTEDQRGRAFGLHRAFDTAGALVGVLVSAFLMWWLTGAIQLTGTEEALKSTVDTPAWVYRAIFAVASVLGLASLMLTFLVRESSPTEIDNDREASERAGSLNGVRSDEPIPPADDTAVGWFKLPYSYWYVVGILVLFSLANSTDTFLLLRASELGFSAWTVVLVYALYNLTYSMIAYPIGILSDRIGRWRIIGLGWAIYAIVYLALAWLPRSQSWCMWPLMAIYGVYMALTDGVGKALIADNSPRHARGAAMGIFYALTGLTTLIASLVTGIIWDRYGATPALTISSILATLALVSLWLMGRFSKATMG